MFFEGEAQPNSAFCKNSDAILDNLELSFSCATQPSFLAKSTNFMVFENFYYTASATGVPDVRSTYTEPSIIASNSGLNLNVLDQGPLKTTPKHFKNTAEIVCNEKWEGSTGYCVSSCVRSTGYCVSSCVRTITIRLKVNTLLELN